ncbi:MAG: ABC transporter permease [Acidobacteriota bacterium]|nr:ABC transporter permease [Acidobacteriota bacterium]
MNSLIQDLRHGLRLLARSPAFTIAAVIVLALGIGANTAIFSIVNGVLLQPLPFKDPDRLVWVWHVPPAHAFPGQKTFSVSVANFLDWEKQNHVFEKMGSAEYGSLNLSGSGDPEAVTAARISPDYFSALGSRPALGRTFLPEENAPGAARSVVLSHDFWKTRFGGDRGIVGREIRFDDQPWRVVGVMGPDAVLPDWAKVWVPNAWTGKDRALRNEHNIAVIARLKPGVDIRRAQAEMNVISQRLAKQYPEDDAEWGAIVVPLAEDIVGQVRPLLVVLLAAVAFVLLIACANVANLMLARTLARKKEIAVRSALGASRERLLRQLIAESLLLSLTGGALGLVLARFGVKGMLSLLADQLPRSAEVRLSLSVLAFTLVVSILTGVLAGLAPAWRGTSTNLVDALKQGLGRTDSDSGGNRTRSALVVAEVALSLILLMGAGLLIRSLSNLQRVNPGFDPRDVTTMTIAPPEARHKEGASRAAFFENVLERLRALPGAESVGAVSFLPLMGGNQWPIAVEGQPALPVSRQPNVSAPAVGGDYFRTLRIPLKRGRTFTSADRADSPGVIVISESMAKRFWPNQDPIGRRLTASFVPEKTREIVGIVGDVKQNGLEHVEPVSQMYFPFSQVPPRRMDFAIRSRSAGIGPAAAAAVHAVDPGQPVQQVGPMSQWIAESLSRQRFGMLLLGSFAALALILAAVGIYSVLSYGVRHRGREIGIRMALGAQMWDVLRLIVFQGMRPAFVGMAIGAAAALALGRALQTLIYGVTATDPWTLGAVALILCLVALAACVAPALRATRLDPIRTLRDE